ncbi:phage minor structural protein [Cytobacillus firmus]|uniref:Phage minor structural protein n=2 Tax=Cytobacillus TaxID=2675230 RepID=A0A366JPU7_CYTFI|nr:MULTISPECIES: phage tail spike protein [Cytobacillus]RBP89402.1 phage minor structural protein [Cytobacillus firmus]TDX47371.1 phage minor structural protein [Cytobacillus oceanisediminis]
MADLYIFDHYDNMLAILSNETNGSVENTPCPFWNAMFKEELNKGSALEFTVPANHVDAKYVTDENSAAFMDKDANFRLFFIRETFSDESDGKATITAVCEPAMMELYDEAIEDKRIIGKSAQEALTSALENTRWSVGTVASLGLNTVNFYYITVKDALEEILNTYGGEFVDRIEIDGNKITGRYIDILTRRGSDTGKRWEIDKDILSLQRTVQSYPKTALYGRGKSIETEDGGFTRKTTFRDVVWSKANGDPVDKPAGQEWVGDPEALEKYGYGQSGGGFRHRFGIYESGEDDDPETLLMNTWLALQQAKKQIVNYSLDGFLLDSVEGYEFEKSRLGDTNFVIDRNFSKPIEVEARVIVYEYDVANPDDVGKIQFGDFIDLYDSDRLLGDVVSKINDKEGIWDKAENPEINGDNLPDILPDVPTLEAFGLFETVLIRWSFQYDMFVSDYELYGSQTPNFIPDSSNLLFRGKTSGFVHSIETDQQWYYRVRGVNTHGHTSAFSSEANTQTVKINGNNDIQPLTITNQLIAQGVSADKITTGTLDAGKVNVIDINATNITTGILTGIEIVSDDGNGNIVQIKDGTLDAYRSNNKIASVNEFGFQVYSEIDGSLVGSIRDEVTVPSNDPGFALNSYKNFLALGFGTTGQTSKRVAYFDRNTRIGEIDGSTEELDNGELILRSTRSGGTAAGRIPKIHLRNFTDTATPPTRWSGVIIDTGRDNNPPGGTDERFGFEVWQYRGTGDGSSKQMMKLDTDSSGTYAGIYTDLAYLPQTRMRAGNNNYFWPSMNLVSQNIQNIHGVQHSSIIGYIDQFTITMDAGQSQTFNDYNFSGAENIFHVIAVPYNSNAVNFNVAVYNQSSTGFRVWMRYIPGTLGSSLTITIRLLILYETIR